MKVWLFELAHTKIDGGNMKLKVWSKTLLNIYNCLFGLSKEIDKIVLGYGLKSGFYGGYSNTYLAIEKIIELSHRKITFINLKVLIEKTLCSLDSLSCKILTLKYCDKMSNEMIIDVLNLKRRTYFRKFNGALSAFASKLLMNGYTVEKIIELIEDESWIIDIFDEIYKKEISGQIECNISKYTIYSNAIKDLRQKRKVEAFI